MKVILNRIFINRDIVKVILSNLLTVISGVVTTILIPMYIDIQEFGYLKIFTLYLGFVGLAHLGFNDGILLKYGNFDYDQLPRRKFRTYFLFLMTFQLFLSVMVGTLSVLIIDDYYEKVIFLFIAFNLLIYNINTYFSFIFQVTRQFKKYATNNNIQNIFFLSLTFLLLIINVESFIPYMIAQTIASLIVTIKNIIDTRELIIGKRESFLGLKEEIVSNFRIGIYILLGNIIAIFIVSINRIVVENYFSLKEFALYSFAASLLGLVFSFITTISSVVYPYLVRVNKNKMNNIYILMYAFIVFITGLSLSTFFILKYFVINILPKYEEALTITMILYPTIIFRALINLIGTNFYQSLGIQKQYNLNNTFALIIACLLNLLGILLRFDLIELTILNTIIFYLWLLITDIYFKLKLQVRNQFMNLLAILISIIFYFTGNMIWYKGLFFFILFYLVILGIFLIVYRKSKSMLNLKKIL